MTQLAAPQILLLVIAAATATASYLPLSVDYEPAVVGHSVHNIPTAVSHQSQTIVHDSRPYLRPIIGHHHVIKTHAIPVSTYEYEPFAYVAAKQSEWAPTYATVKHNDWSPSYETLKHDDWPPNYGSLLSAWRK